MNKLYFTKEEAKQFLVRYHMINTEHNLFGKEGIIDVTTKIQSLQYDPLDVVGRNIDLVLQSRISDYKRHMLTECLYHDRTLIDGWDKQMSVFLTVDFPKMKYVREDRAESDINAVRKYLKFDPLEYTEEVLDILYKEGAHFSKDIHLCDERVSKWSKNGAKKSSVVLDYLYFKGLIGVSERKNTSKKYDILHRLIGEIAMQKNPFSNIEEFTEFYLLRRIKSMGLCFSKSQVLKQSKFSKDKDYVPTAIKSLVRKNLIHEVEVEGFNDIFFIPYNSQLDKTELVDRVSFIAPLDNMIWDRDVIEQLFGFRYRWEVYTPIKKREYGYYVLPILHKSDFIGRIEFEKHRGGKLVVKGIWYEKGIKKREVKKFISQAIKRFEQYLQ